MYGFGEQAKVASALQAGGSVIGKEVRERSEYEQSLERLATEIAENARFVSVLNSRLQMFLRPMPAEGTSNLASRPPAASEACSMVDSAAMTVAGTNAQLRSVIESLTI